MPAAPSVSSTRCRTCRSTRRREECFMYSLSRSSAMGSRPSLRSGPGVAPALLIVIVALSGAARAESRDASAAPAPTAQPARTILRVAADPNNLPFSNDELQGFENKIANVIAQDLGLKVEYVWHAQRRGFVRQTMKDGDADVMITCPTGLERVWTTKPYFRSTYVFVTRKDSPVHITSLDDPQLKTLKVAVQVTGDANTPPAQALG